ncbi:MAG: CDF family Co(II)/Ni(II) efflux transporter DmeF [Myxococcaceae bacterium]|nr:CDF family Co(II)/Ni(II) efflux transporter DmeF [Myxococcaceae bacterium]
MTPASEVTEADCSARQAPPVPHGGERRTRVVVGLTAVMMVAELIAGYLTHSLALTADGWHMATHVGALGLSAVAYWYARTRAAETRFAFGTGKVYALAGFTSSTLLLLVSFEMVSSGIQRLIEPEAVHFADALPVAIIGLLVNLASAWLLGGSHDHGHHDHAHHDHAHHGHAHHDGHGHSHANEATTAGAVDGSAELRKSLHEHGHDQNLRAAYLHVVADALTSLLAILALVAGRSFAVTWLDPVVALVAAAVILRWAWGLITDCARQLIDLGPSVALREKVKATLEGLGDTEVRDLHLWHVGPTQLVCVASVTSSGAVSLADYKRAVRAVVPVDHLTIEIGPRGDAA